MAVSLHDQSATGSAATGIFQPVFGAVGTPASDKTPAIAIAAVAVVFGIILWKKLK